MEPITISVLELSSAGRNLGRGSSNSKNNATQRGFRVRPELGTSNLSQEQPLEVPTEQKEDQHAVDNALERRLMELEQK